MKLTETLDSLRPYTLALLRIVGAFLFWHHGLQKVFGWMGGHQMPPFTLLWFAGMMELIAAPLLMVGLLTRPVALLLCGEMTFAYVTQHLPKGFWPIAN